MPNNISPFLDVPSKLALHSKDHCFYASYFKTTISFGKAEILPTQPVNSMGTLATPKEGLDDSLNAPRR
ncbi:hypothetical protein CASFOL_010472 [Castilleja foliolosa]|uniref:Uncharacterized protein n=1 Tax=Castilleja foliolosa TaxID=1961234 RepID=A0ABD3DUL0_9LAMI